MKKITIKSITEGQDWITLDERAKLSACHVADEHMSSLIIVRRDGQYACARLVRGQWRVPCIYEGANGMESVSPDLDRAVRGGMGWGSRERMLRISADMLGMNN